MTRQHVGLDTVRFVAAGRSDLGGGRADNEDTIFVGSYLVAVADGVGGSAAGEVASQEAISAISYLEDRSFRKGEEGELADGLHYANGRLGRTIEADASLTGMATTLTALRLGPSSVGVLHVGDSRAYRVGAEGLAQITRDDSLMQDYIDAGVLTPEQAATDRRRSVILQALSGQPVVPSIAILQVHPDDRFLLCSDGLSDYVRHDEIAEVVLDKAKAPERCVEELIALALGHGTRDNVSCVVADVRREY
ncbi:MAG: PP2C family protein-serine/threonine phosphatase [Jatrophihabitans sp.]